MSMIRYEQQSLNSAVLRFVLGLDFLRDKFNSKL